MKPIYTLLFYCLLCSGVAAQEQRIEIHCEIRGNSLYYEKLADFLPDSVQPCLLTFRDKPFSYALDKVNVMTLRGWTLVGKAHDMNNITSSNIKSESVYVLRRELTVSAAEYRAILERTQNYVR